MIPNMIPNSSDPKYDRWREEEGTIQYWFLENMADSYSDRFLYLPTVKDIWEKAKQSHSKEHDESQIYRLVQKSILLVQGGRSVLEYASELECIWREIDHYRPVINPDTEERKYTLKDRLYKFLMGLNFEYETLVNQILAREKVPIFEETLKLVVRKESTRLLRHDIKTNPDSTVFLAKQMKEPQGASKEPKEQKQKYIKGDPNTDPKAHLLCTHCGKWRHTVENCWDLHGKPKTYGKSHMAKTNSSGDSEGSANYLSKVPVQPVDQNQIVISRLQEELAALKTAFGQSAFAHASKQFPNDMAYCLSTSVVKPIFLMTSGKSWVLDSGASDHMTADMSLFENFSHSKVKKGVITAGGHILPVLGIGDVKLGNFGTLRRVLFVPELKANLISLFHLGSDLHCRIIFDDDNCCFIDKISGKEIGRFKAQDGLFRILLSGGLLQQGPANRLSSASISSSVSLNKLFQKHCQLGHPFVKILRFMFPNLCQGLDKNTLFCEACQLAKQKRISFPFVGNRSNTPLFRIHSDIWGPSATGVRGAKWFIIFVDDCTRLTWIYMMANKSEASSIILPFIRLLQNQFDTTPKRFRSDNARDFFNRQVSSFFEDTGIVHESSCPYTPEQNGVAERKIGHLMEVARAMMFTSHAPKHLWSEALLTAVYLVNRLPSEILSLKSPKDVFLHHYPKVQLGPELPHHIFGCVAYVHQSQPGVGKWSPRALKVAFVGYSNTQKGYKFYDPSSGRIIIAISVTFDDSKIFFQDQQARLLGGPQRSENDQSTLNPSPVVEIISPTPSNAAEGVQTADQYIPTEAAVHEQGDQNISNPLEEENTSPRLKYMKEMLGRILREQ